MAYVYKHIRLDNEEIFYIGICSNDKENRAYSKSSRNNMWNKIVSKGGYRVEFVKQNITFEEAKKLEINLIKDYGRKDLGLGALSNMTDGGDGTAGWIAPQEFKNAVSERVRGDKNYMYGKTHSEETKDKLRQINKGKKLPQSQIDNIRKSLIGKTHSEETKKKIGDKHRGKIISEESKQKFRETMTGRESSLKGTKFSDERLIAHKNMMANKIVSDETKKKISDSRKGDKHPFFGKPCSESRKENIRKALVGRVFTEEWKSNMSKAQIGLQSGGKNPRAKMVINLENGIYYDCAKDVSKIYNIGYSNLKSKLNGGVQNKTQFIYV
jgi:hypothetical protein